MATTLTSRLVMEVVDRVTAPSRGMARSILGIGEAVRDANGRQAASFGQRLNDAIERNNAALDRARGRMVDAVAGFYALRGAIQAPIKAAIEFESAMADVAKVVDFDTPESFLRFQRDLFELSRQIPLTLRELAEIAAAAGEAGFAADEVLQVTEDAARIAVAFGSNAREAGDLLAAMQQSYGMTRQEALLLTDAMNALSNSMASSAPELADFWTRVAADAATAGFTHEQAVALGSAMIASGHSADVAATSFRAMVRALTRGDAATARQRAAFQALGLDVTDVARQMQQDAVGTTRQVLAAIGQMPAEVQNALRSDIFGDEARALGSIATNLDFFDRAIATVGDSTTYAGSALREFEVRAQTTENAVTLLRNRMTELSVSVGQALLPALNKIVSVIGPVITGIAELAAAYPKVTAAVVGATAAVVAFKVAAAALTYIGLVGRGGALAAIALGFNTIGRAGIRLGGAARESLRLSDSLAAMSGAQRLTGISRIATAVKAMALAVPGVGTLVTKLGGLGAVIATISAPAWGIFAAAVGAISAAGFLIYRYWDRLSAIFRGVGRALGDALLRDLEMIRPILDWFAPIGDIIASAWSGLADIFSSVGEAISNFFTRETLSEEDAAAWEEWGYQAVQSLLQPFRDMIEWFRGLPGRILAAIGSIDLSGLLRWPSLPSWLGGGESMESFSENFGSEPARARGGPISRGGRYLVGEEGPELITASRSGYVQTAGRTAGALRGGGVAVHVGGITVNGGNASPMEIAMAVQARIEAAVREALRGVQGDVGMTTY